MNQNKEKPSDFSMNDYCEKQIMNDRLSKIKHKIFVFSGKGGVGKSTVAVNIASHLANDGFKVGLLDIDIHGPSIPKLLNLENINLIVKDEIIEPVQVSKNLKVVSIGFLIESAKSAIIWRGPRKAGIIRQFIKDVNWNELDYLIVDSPPGTGDEPLTICQTIPNADGAVIVTTPQQIAIVDVQKAVTFCRDLNVKILGVVENMSGFTCPSCGKEIKLFKSGGGKEMSEKMNVNFLGEIPFETEIVDSCDDGSPYVNKTTTSNTKDKFKNMVVNIVQLTGGGK